MLAKQGRIGPNVQIIPTAEVGKYLSDGRTLEDQSSIDPSKRSARVNGYGHHSAAWIDSGSLSGLQLERRSTAVSWQGHPPPPGADRHLGSWVTRVSPH